MKSEKIMRLPEVRQMTGLSISTIWRKEKEGSFPKRISIGPRAVGWLLSEIGGWIEAKKQLSRGEL